MAPDEVFRIAAPCACSGCGHFDSTQSSCTLAQKIVRWVPMVSESLPVCSIRSECRWWQQEGRAACLRCPQVVTRNGKPAAVLVSVEEWEKKAAPQGTLVEFFQSSPLHDSGIEIERFRGGFRKVDL